MHKHNRHGPLANRGGAALDGTMPDVSGGEYSRDIRFHVKRVSVERPIIGQVPVFLQVGPGHKITALVAHDANLLSPLCSWRPAQAQEKPTGLDCALLASILVSESDSLQNIFTVKSNHLGTEAGLYLGTGLNAIHQVLRNCVFKR